VASINGLVCGGLLALVAGLWQGDPRLGAVVGISLFAGMIVAGITGTFYPLVLRRLRVDPAIASGPFVTVSNDVLNLLIYFTVASVALSWLMAGR
jgi:magnesium transporter